MNTAIILSPTQLARLVKQVTGKDVPKNRVTQQMLTELDAALKKPARPQLPYRRRRTDVVKQHTYTGTAPSPVQLVRETCEELMGHPRQEVIRACVEKGVNPHTAATQYQRWFASHQVH